MKWWWRYKNSTYYFELDIKLQFYFFVATMIYAHFFVQIQLTHTFWLQNWFFVVKSIYAFFFVAKTICALRPESFCVLKIAIRKVQTFWASGAAYCPVNPIALSAVSSCHPCHPYQCQHNTKLLSQKPHSLLSLVLYMILWFSRQILAFSSQMPSLSTATALWVFSQFLAGGLNNNSTSFLILFFFLSKHSLSCLCHQYECLCWTYL